MGFFNKIFGAGKKEAIRSAVLASDFDLSTMESMLRSWPNLSQTIYSPTHTLLHDVAQYARIRGPVRTQLAISLLLESGADINAQDWEGKTALAWVCQSNFHELETATLLVSKGANSNLLDNQGVSAFHRIVSVASHKSYYKLAELMINNGANVNLPCGNDGENPFYCPKGSTPLHLAVRDGSDPKSSEIVKLLLKNGADPQARDSRGHLYTG